MNRSNNTPESPQQGDGDSGTKVGSSSCAGAAASDHDVSAITITSEDEKCGMHVVQLFAESRFKEAYCTCVNILNKCNIHVTTPTQQFRRELPTKNTATTSTTNAPALREGVPMLDAFAFLMLRYIWSMKPDLFLHPSVIDPWDDLMIKCTSCSPESLKLMFRVINLCCYSFTGPSLSTAKFFLGVLHDKGIGCRKDCDEALRLYRASSDYAWSTYYIGLSYVFGDGVQKDNAEAAKYVIKAVQMGLPTAYGKLAQQYCFGLGLTKDVSEGIRYAKIGAELGCSYCQTLLSFGYRFGTEFQPMDTDTANKLDWKAAMNGAGEAHHCLSFCYDNGEGGFATDLREALRWCRLGCSQGCEPQPGRTEEIMQIVNQMSQSPP
ncbi:hypothetical protein Pelo_14772 [Pelomyxa schiedti]|nr:hypothetical protein Pelo_14772 [Pelomyxa schiedti]